MFDKYDEYTEGMLLAQYRVSEMINHKLTRGEVREDFLKLQIELQYDGIRCCKGVIADCEGQNQSEQIDLIIAKPNAQVRRMGSHSLISVDDAVFIIEVKSNATGADFTALNSKANRYKSMNGGQSLLVGMFCYNYDLKMKTVLRRFGYAYDEEVQGFQKQSGIALQYNSIDFAVSLDENEEEDTGQQRGFFVMKDETGGYALYLERSPVSKYFFRLLRRSIR
jgi:hypothetical protein